MARHEAGPMPSDARAGERVRCGVNLIGGAQCRKFVTRDGRCGTHHPDARKRRDQKFRARMDAQREAADRRYALNAEGERLILAVRQADMSALPPAVAAARRRYEDALDAQEVEDAL